MAPSCNALRLSSLPACPRRDAVCATLRRFLHRSACLAQSPGSSVPPPAAVREALPLYPRGPWLRPELCCLGPSPLTTTPSASLAGTRRLHGRAAYTPRLRCAGAPRRPTRPSRLSLLCFPRAPMTLHRWVPCALPVVHTHRVPGCLGLSTSRHPQRPASASDTRRGYAFRCCIIRVMLRLACLPGPPDWLRRSEVICAPLRLLRTVSSPLLTPSVARRRWGSG
jgi:hypothetical protein